MKNRIKVNYALIKHKNADERSRIFCDEIEYMHDREGDIFDHHLMFWLKGKLVFKVWLKNDTKDKEYKDVYEALKDVDIEGRMI